MKLKKILFFLILCMILASAGSLFTACNKNYVYYKINIPTESEQRGYSFYWVETEGDDNGNIIAKENSNFQFSIIVDVGYDMSSLKLCVNDVELQSTGQTAELKKVDFVISSIVEDQTISVEISPEEKTLELTFTKLDWNTDDTFLQNKYTFQNEISFLTVFKFDEATQNIINTPILSITATELFDNDVDKTLNEIYYNDMLVVELFAKPSCNDLCTNQEAIGLYNETSDEINTENTNYVYVQRNEKGQKVLSSNNTHGARFVFSVRNNGVLNFNNDSILDDSLLNNVIVQINSETATISRIGGTDYQSFGDSATYSNYSKFYWTKEDGDYCFNVNSIDNEEIANLTVYVNNVALQPNPGQIEFKNDDSYTGDAHFEDYEFCIPVSVLESNTFIKISAECEYSQTAKTHYLLDIEKNSFSADQLKAIDFTYYNLYGMSEANNEMYISPTTNFENFCNFSLNCSSLTTEIKLSNGYFVDSSNLNDFVSVYRKNSITSEFELISPENEYNLQFIQVYDSYTEETSTDYSHIIIAFDSEEITNDIKIVLNGNQLSIKTFDVTLPIAQSGTFYFLNPSLEWIEVTSENQNVSLFYNKVVILKFVPHSSDYWLNYLAFEDENGDTVVDNFSYSGFYHSQDYQQTDYTNYFYVKPNNRNITILAN